MRPHGLARDPADGRPSASPPPRRGLPRFRVPLNGLGIHFVHVRAAAPAGPVLPLVLSHGWPDSFWRYAKVIPLLTDPGAHGSPARRWTRNSF